MAKAYKETLLKSIPDTNLKIDPDKVLQAIVYIRGVFLDDQYRVKRICTKRDNDLKAVIDAHLETRASEQASHSTCSS